MSKHEKKGAHHTGKMHRGHGHLKSHKGRDEHASESHHAANKKHGMAKGFAPDEEYEEGSCKDSHLGCNESE